MIRGIVSIVLLVALAVLLPLLFGELMLDALERLHLSPRAALVLLLAMLVGGLVNLPVKTIVREFDVPYHPLEVFGLGGLFPQLERVRRATVIAVNLGGCVIPVGLVLYQVYHLFLQSPQTLVVCGIGVVASVFVCFQVARPVPDVGIVMPTFVSPLFAAAIALVFAPEAAAPVAFVVGVMGPLIGADLLHLRDLDSYSTGVMSIGGAGTFDGIVLSGILAAYLA
jgi:uncharacterized membrane protein